MPDQPTNPNLVTNYEQKNAEQPHQQLPVVKVAEPHMSGGAPHSIAAPPPQTATELPQPSTPAQDQQGGDMMQQSLQQTNALLPQGPTGPQGGDQVFPGAPVSKMPGQDPSVFAMNQGDPNNFLDPKNFPTLSPGDPIPQAPSSGQPSPSQVIADTNPMNYLLKQGSDTMHGLGEQELAHNYVPTWYQKQGSDNLDQEDQKFRQQLTEISNDNLNMGLMKPKPQTITDPTKYRPDATGSMMKTFWGWLGSWGAPSTNPFDPTKGQFGEAGNGPIGGILYTLGVVPNAVLGAVADLRNTNPAPYGRVGDAFNSVLNRAARAIDSVTPGWMHGVTDYALTHDFGNDAANLYNSGVKYLNQGLSWASKPLMNNTGQTGKSVLGAGFGNNVQLPSASLQPVEPIAPTPQYKGSHFLNALRGEQSSFSGTQDKTHAFGFGSGGNISDPRFWAGMAVDMLVYHNVDEINPINKALGAVYNKIKPRGRLVPLSTEPPTAPEAGTPKQLVGAPERPALPAIGESSSPLNHPIKMVPPEGEGPGISVENTSIKPTVTEGKPSVNSEVMAGTIPAGNVQEPGKLMPRRRTETPVSEAGTGAGAATPTPTQAPVRLPAPVAVRTGRDIKYVSIPAPGVDGPEVIRVTPSVPKAQIEPTTTLAASPTPVITGTPITQAAAKLGLKFNSPFEAMERMSEVTDWMNNHKLSLEEAVNNVNNNVEYVHPAQMSTEDLARKVISGNVLTGVQKNSDIVSALSTMKPGMQVDPAMLNKSLRTIDEMDWLARVIPGPDGAPLLGKDAVALKRWGQIDTLLQERGATDPIYKTIFAPYGAEIPKSVLAGGEFNVLAGDGNPLAVSVDTAHPDTSMDVSPLSKPGSYIIDKANEVAKAETTDLAHNLRVNITDPDVVGRPDALRDLQRSRIPDTEVGQSHSSTIQTQAKLNAERQAANIAATVNHLQDEVTKQSQVLNLSYQKLENSTVDIGRRMLPTVPRPLETQIPAKYAGVALPNSELAADLNGRSFFHGTKVQEWTPDVNWADGSGRHEWGHGTYVVSDVETARTFADAKATDNLPAVSGRLYSDAGTVHEVKLSTHSPLDTRVPLRPAVANQVKNAFREILREVGGVNKDEIANFTKSIKGDTPFGDYFTQMEKRLIASGVTDEETLHNVSKVSSLTLHSMGFDAITDGDKVNLLSGNAQLLDSQARVANDVLGQAASRYNADSLVSSQHPQSPLAQVNQMESNITLQSRLLDKTKEDLQLVEDEGSRAVHRLLSADKRLQQVAEPERLSAAQQAKADFLADWKSDFESHTTEGQNNPCEW